MQELNDPSNQGPFTITDQNNNGRIDALDLLTPTSQGEAGNDLGTGGWADGVDYEGNGYIDDVTGWDASAGDNNPTASAGTNHGTHVAGIIAAHTDNAVGTAGVAGNVRLMPVRFYGTGNWTSAKIYLAYAYAADNGARIVSTSYNVDSFVSDPTFTAALDYLYGKGVLHFNSAGNNNQLNPARGQFDQTLYVVSSNSQDRKSPSSNYGYTMDLAAPGENIYSTFSGDSYGSLGGTSMAAPAAAAVAALIWSLHPQWSRDQVAAQLLASADNIDGQNVAYTGLLGAGRVNTYRALLEPAGSPMLGNLIGLPAPGGVTSSRIRSFEVSVANVLDSATVRSPASWQLRRAGLDGRFDTADDGIVPLRLITDYLIGTNRLAFTLNGPLSPGLYQFRAYSGGLKDPFGQSLDGNRDGQGGDHLLHTFRVTISGHVAVRTLVSTPVVSSPDPSPGTVSPETRVTGGSMFPERTETGRSVRAAGPVRTRTAARPTAVNDALVDVLDRRLA
jgi:hypothetical protein